MNKIEKLKASLLPIEFKDRLKDLDYFNLSEADRFYLKSFGIYNIKLRPEKFMLRVRFDGLSILPEELEAVIDIAREFDLQVVLTARGGLEFHNISPDKIYKIYQLSQKKGLKTHQSLTDNFRAITTDPFSDFAKDSYFKIDEIVESIRDYILDNPKLFGLIPRKFNTALISRENPIGSFWANDALFALAKKGKEFGFNLYLGGKNSEVAKSADIFITPDKTKELFQAVVEVFNEDGLRATRSKMRLFHLIEAVGMEKVREKIQNKLKWQLQSEGELLLKEPKEVDFIELRDGYFGQRVLSKYGEIELSDLESILEIAKKEAQIKIGIDQNLYLITKTPLKKEPKSNLNIVACVGSRYCPLSLWDIKRDIDYLNIERLKRLKIKVRFSGCLKGCGRHYHSDIGLIGLRTNLYAPTERAFRVFIGAIYDSSPAPARMLYYSVPKRCFNELLGVILDDFEASKSESFLEFSKILNSYQIEVLQLWFLARIVFGLSKETKEIFFKKDEKELLNALSKEIDLSDLTEAIRDLSHKAWDLK